MHAKFITIYDQTVDDIFAYCFQKTHNKEVAKIITKEVYAKTWDGINEAFTPSEIKKLVYTIAKNAIKEEVRQKSLVSNYYPSLKMI
jgi:DNA-directed RNA polymerase specialized sigma24 family protein